MIAMYMTSTKCHNLLYEGYQGIFLLESGQHHVISLFLFIVKKELTKVHCIHFECHPTHKVNRTQNENCLKKKLKKKKKKICEI